MIQGAVTESTLAKNHAPSLAVLKYFSQLPDARLCEMTAGGEGNQYSVIQATLGAWIGTGRGKSRFLSTLKAVAECLERRFFDQYIDANIDVVPHYKRNTNGFAVHFHQEEAKLAATREALERHILQITYLKDGWDGFYLLGGKMKGDLKITQVVSKYQVNGYSAGIVLAQSSRFPGVAFGYYCDETKSLKTSERWLHAEAEAIDKIEPILTLTKANSLKTEGNIDREIFKWFFEPFQMPDFKHELQLQALPEVEPNVEIFDLQEVWQLEFPFYAAKCDGDTILPLLIPTQKETLLDQKLSELFHLYKINSGFPQRNPIL